MCGSRSWRCARNGSSGASAGEAASHFRHVRGEALGELTTIELGDCRSLTHYLGEELADEMRKGEAALGGHCFELGS